MNKQYMYLAAAFLAGAVFGPMLKEKLWPAAPAAPGSMPRA